MKTFKLFAAAIAVFAMIATSCEALTGDQADNGINPSELIILHVGESYSFNLNSIPGKEFPDLAWTTGDCLSLSKDGVVTAVSPGLDAISAVAGEEVLYTCPIYVYNDVCTIYKDALPVGSPNAYYGETFVRRWFLMTELRGDNVCLSGVSSDALYNNAIYDNETPALTSNTYMWGLPYAVIDDVNRRLDGEILSSRDKGEMLFLRAYSYYSLVSLFCKPYSLGRDNAGVPLKLGEGASATTVGEIYDMIVKDLNEASELLPSTTPQDKGTLSATAAKALLARVYLYMEKNQECLDVCNSLLGSQPAANLDTDLDNYPKNTRTSKETIWCISHNPQDSKERGSIGSMYYSPDELGGTGWGEMYWSDPLMELILRYPSDKRYKAYFHQFGKLDDGTKMIHWPAPNENMGNYGNIIIAGDGITPGVNGNYKFSYDGVKYETNIRTVNGYPEYFINYKGKDTKVYIRDNADQYVGFRHTGAGTFPCYFMTKFTGQDGDSNLSSPVILRWAEVILNRAEAYAKLGRSQEALDDVNVIRTRAGLAGDALMTMGNYASRGYESILDVVLDERRLELCFEGHRPFDVFRNKKSLDRRYPGVHTWEVINYDEDRIPYKRP